jgi:hypothetical protein
MQLTKEFLARPVHKGDLDDARVELQNRRHVAGVDSHRAARRVDVHMVNNRLREEVL